MAVEMLPLVSTRNCTTTRSGWWLYIPTPLKKIRVRQLGWWEQPNRWENKILQDTTRSFFWNLAPWITGRRIGRLSAVELDGSHRYELGQDTPQTGWPETDCSCRNSRWAVDYGTKRPCSLAIEAKRVRGQHVLSWSQDVPILSAD